MTQRRSIGWDHAATARIYEEFCERHERYRRANLELVRHARLAGGQRMLDLAAGTGRTAEAILGAGWERGQDHLRRAGGGDAEFRAGWGGARLAGWRNVRGSGRV